MEPMTIIAIISALGGWGAFSYALNSRDKFATAYRNERAENAELTQTLSLTEKHAEILQMSATVAGDELRAARHTNTALAAKCADLTKQLIATRENLEEADKIREGAITLAAARWAQLEELRSGMELPK